MGGRLDATNVVTPLVAIITRIGLEHTAYLGNTIAAIAGEKAGIIKRGRPVVCGAMPSEAGDVMRAVAVERGAEFVDAAGAAVVCRVSQSFAGQKVSASTPSADYGTFTMSLLGRHQLENCATALAAIDCIRGQGIAMPSDVVAMGLAGTRWPGRLEVLSETPPVLLDGAHNPDGARVLGAALKELCRKKKVGLVWGMCDDKDAQGFAHALGGIVNHCWAVPLQTERSMSPDRLVSLAEGEGWVAESESLDNALRHAMEWAVAENGAVCVAGSLFLAGEVLQLEGRAL